MNGAIQMDSRMVEDHKGGLILCLIIAVVSWFAPKLWNKSENASTGQLDLYKQDLNECKAEKVIILHKYDSVAIENSQLRKEKADDYKQQIKDLQAAAAKYRDAMIKVKKANATIDNIQNTVTHEIK